jgi:glycosyltransferase involved in cell wall biosynthesis
MNAPPLVSIVTPSLNQGAYLEEALRSVLEQNYRRIEYWVIDGGSTDGSQAILQRYAGRLAGWVSEPDRGQAHAINKGLRRAQGEILGWLNADDALLPGAVQTVVSAFSADPAIDVVYGRLERMDDRGQPVRTPQLPKDRVEFAGLDAIGECVVNQPGAFWRRGIMEKAGLLDESLRYVLDYEYWLRMLLAGGRFRRLPERLARFRLSEGSKTVREAAGMAQEHLAVLDRTLARPELAERLGVDPGALRRQARRGRAVLSLYACRGCWKAGRRAEALRWLAAAHRHDPAVLLHRRWLDLALARLRRPGTT